MDKPIEFMVTLDANAWNQVMAGWNCDALRIPDAAVTEMYHGGRRADDRDFTQKDTMILWTSGIARPDVVAARIKLPPDLKRASDVQAVEQQKLKLEEDKLKLERDGATAKDKLERDLAAQRNDLELKKLDAEKRLKTYAAIGTVLTALLSGAVTYAVSKPKANEACRQSLVKLHAAADPNLKDQSLEKLRSAVERHAEVCGRGD